MFPIFFREREREREIRSDGGGSEGEKYIYVSDIVTHNARRICIIEMHFLIIYSCICVCELGSREVVLLMYTTLQKM